jgi:hypothetical protein
MKMPPTVVWLFKADRRMPIRQLNARSTGDDASDRPGRPTMNTYYDMNTGEWISGDEAEPTARAVPRYPVPAPTPRLMSVYEDVDTSHRKPEIPADIVTLPASAILDRWS